VTNWRGIQTGEYPQNLPKDRIFDLDILDAFILEHHSRKEMVIGDICKSWPGFEILWHRYGVIDDIVARDDFPSKETWEMPSGKYVIRFDPPPSFDKTSNASKLAETNKRILQRINPRPSYIDTVKAMKESI
jgi:hypothetical protein